VIRENKLSCVLLVDDDEPTTFMYKMVLEESGCADRIHIAQGGTEAIDFLISAAQREEKDYPDLIFLDINMPRMDGWEFLQQYQKMAGGKKKQTVIIMLSTSLNPDDETRAAHIHEIAAFRHKPLTAGIVREIVAKYFSS
jgi:CheY-like chemotaxis protein